MNGRLLLAVAGALAVVVALAYLVRDAPPTLSGSFDLVVEDRAGSVMFNLTVEVGEATPYHLLAAGAHARGYQVVKEGEAGHCDVYVSSIGGIAEMGSGGWVYEVRHSDGTAQHPAVAADCFALHPGDSVRWHWTDAGVQEG